jgi:membrane protease YdiL (CAAX protease family)
MFIAAGYGWLQGAVTPGPAALALLVVVYPLLEEVVFRGLIQPALIKPTRGRGFGPLTLANGLTSVLFAAMHLLTHPPLHSAAVLLPSLVFGAFRDRSGSVLPGMLLHVSWNAALLLSPLAWS